MPSRNFENACRRLRGRTVRYARAVRKVGYFPLLIPSFWGVWGVWGACSCHSGGALTRRIHPFGVFARCKVVNRQCKMDSISFAIPSADSPPHYSPSPPPPPLEERGRSPSRSATLLPHAKPRAPKTTQWSREAGKQLAAKVTILEGGLTSVNSEDWKEVIEWLLKRKEETGKMKWDDAAWHFLPRWGLADHKDPDCVA